MGHILGVLALTLGYWPVIVSLLSERIVTLPAIGVDDGSLLYVVPDKRHERRCRGIWDYSKSNPTRPNAGFAKLLVGPANEFNGADHKDFRHSPATWLLFHSSDVILVDLYLPMQWITTHRTATGTYKPIRPANLHEVLCTGFLCREVNRKCSKSSWDRGFYHFNLATWVPAPPSSSNVATPASLRI